MPSWVPSVGWAITLYFIVISYISRVVLSFLDCLPIWAVTYWYMAVTFILTANSRANDTSILDTAIWNSFLSWSSLLLIFWHPELSPINLCMSPVLLSICMYLIVIFSAGRITDDTSVFDAMLSTSSSCGLSAFGCHMLSLDLIRISWLWCMYFIDILSAVCSTGDTSDMLPSIYVVPPSLAGYCWQPVFAWAVGSVILPFAISSLLAIWLQSNSSPWPPSASHTSTLQHIIINI